MLKTSAVRRHGEVIALKRAGTCKRTINTGVGMHVIETQDLSFLKGNGEMATLVRKKNWEATELGPIEQWPQSLRITVSIVLNSQFPMFIWWGPKMITIYNDAYRMIAGEKHPAALGESGQKVWSEIWDVVGPLANKVMNEGVSNWAEDQLLFINRRGFVEETYFTFSYSPILDESGSIAGVFCACTETTEKVMATRRLRESERNLRNTILQSPVAMCIFRGPDYVVEIANQRMFEFWGREVIGVPIFEGLPEVREQGLEELLDQVKTTGVPFSASERPVQLPRGGKIETVYVNFVYQPFREGDGTISGIIAVATEVTDQVLARKKIEESEQELTLRVKQRTAELERQSHLVDNILKNSSNGISVSEMVRNEKGEVIDSRTILANKAAIRFTGLPEDIYLTKTAREIAPDILESPLGQMSLRTLETGEPTFTQYFLEYSQRWLELTVSKMDDDHLINIFTDVTPVKAAQLQLERTVEELKRSNANLEEFAYAASHDMKEPIRKIHFFSDRLKEELQEKLTEHQRQLFTRMENAAQRMKLLIDDLLAYSHVSKGVPEMEEIDLNKKVKTVLEDLELEVQEKSAIIKLNQLPKIKGHRRQIQQLFQNLIGNALKYSRPGVPPEITINASIAKGNDVMPNLSAEEGGKDFHFITVKDNGVGFEQKDADRIFNMFIRLHGSAEYRGTGVGLSIARKVVENHRGYISAESQPGKGSTFKILLPVNNGA